MTRYELAIPSGVGCYYPYELADEDSHDEWDPHMPRL